MASATPAGKRSSFAHQTRASYLLVEKGNQQPRSLAAAQLKGIEGKDLLGDSIKGVSALSKKLDAAYGPCADERRILNVEKGEGSIADLVAFTTDG